MFWWCGDGIIWEMCAYTKQKELSCGEKKTFSCVNKVTDKKGITNKIKYSPFGREKTTTTMKKKLTTVSSFRFSNVVSKFCA